MFWHRTTFWMANISHNAFIRQMQGEGKRVLGQDISKAKSGLSAAYNESIIFSSARCFALSNLSIGVFP